MYHAFKGTHLKLFNNNDISMIHENVVKLLGEVGMLVKIF